ncbi:MAG: site-2 protease family protein [Mesorhizobium sp.]|nr:site-2 protease family protein [Mesorhizobium sp.]
MSWSLRIATIAGTQVRVHITFALILVWCGWMHYQIGGMPAAWEGVLFILAVFACVVAHEFGHAFAARCYGISTTDITLLPIGGLARLERMPEDPLQEFVIALAGPAVNLVIAALILVLLGGTGQLADMVQIQDPRVDFLVRLAGVNIFLVVFNLLPAFPMDGGRVLRAVLASRMSWTHATHIAAMIGQGMAFGMAFLGLFFNPILIFFAILVHLAASAENQNAQMRDVAYSVLVGDVTVRQYATLTRKESLAHAVEALLDTSQHEFPVVSPDGRLEGVLTRDDMIRALKEDGPQAAVETAMQTDIPTIHHRQCLTYALKLMQESSAPAVAALDSAGRLVGLITHENIGEMMMVRSAVPEGFRFGRLRQAG